MFGFVRLLLNGLLKSLDLRLQPHQLANQGVGHKLHVGCPLVFIGLCPLHSGKPGL
jgi:hypothetical protein